MQVIENKELLVWVSEGGAELFRIYSKSNHLEYLWSGDPAFWAKRSPVLFPIVGTLKGDRYTYNGKDYTMTRHGFAREKVFRVIEAAADTVLLELGSDEGTLGHYPFYFDFRIRYRLRKNCLIVEYMVINKGDGTMYFSLGAHPAFRVPLVNGTTYEDYYLLFEQKETLDRWPISKEGLLEIDPERVLDSSDRLPLHKQLFQRDALVFKRPLSQRISLRSDKTSHGIELLIAGFPYLGIWAARNAEFVCIEPWCGIADSVSTDHQLINKEGIEQIRTGHSFERTLEINFF